MPAPEHPQYRITLFYGPEPLDGSPAGYRCVFNVKKRSWKGGVQVAVDVDGDQVRLAEEAAGFPTWLTEVLDRIDQAERQAYAERAREILVQVLCSMKLDLAIQAGLAADNHTLPVDELADPLADKLAREGHGIRAQILTELDVNV